MTDMTPADMDRLDDRELARLRAMHQYAFPSREQIEAIKHAVRLIAVARQPEPDGLREAIERFGVHLSGCGVWTTGSPTSGATDSRCNCGLRAALATPSPSPEPLDMERLTRAIREAFGVLEGRIKGQEVFAWDIPRVWLAEAVAVEYARLATEPSAES